MAEETKLNRVVMVIRDERVLRAMWQEFLTHCGFTVYSASNGREALDILATRPHPGLILLDPETPMAPAMMPPGVDVMNEGELMRALKADESTAAIPVAVFSWRNIDPASLGAVRVIRRPFRLEDILEVLEAYCGPVSDGSIRSQP